MDYKNLKKTDSEVYQLNKAEEKRQLESINLIASENYISPAVREALSSVFSNKYSEGYPKKRYYSGNKYVDEAEELAQKRALNLFNLNKKEWGVNVQPYSGSPANFEVYSAILKKNDVALGMKLSSGGHLTHGHKVSSSGKFFKFVQYGVRGNGEIDYEQIDALAKKYNPRLIIAGTSAYSKIIDYKKFSEIAKKYNALLMADMAHIAGLVAVGMHPSPFPYFDIVTTTTHKTLRGPRGAIIFAKKELMPSIDKAVFPGFQGGPHNNTTLAIAVALKEATSNEFKKYSKQIIKNADILANSLKSLGYSIVSGSTETHLFLIDLNNKNISGTDAERTLEKNHITTNRNSIPNDKNKPMNPSGIRIGTPAVTTRGMQEKEMKKIAKFIDKALRGEDVSKEIQKLALKFPPPEF